MNFLKQSLLFFIVISITATASIHAMDTDDSEMKITADAAARIPFNYLEQLWLLKQAFSLRDSMQAAALTTTAAGATHVVLPRTQLANSRVAQQTGQIITLGSGAYTLFTLGRGYQQNAETYRTSEGRLQYLAKQQKESTGKTRK